MIDTKLLTRVRGLLTKAEDPATTQAEAETYTAKAAELMAKYGIEQAMLAAETGDNTITSITIPITGKYSREQATLISYIANPLGGRDVTTYRGRAAIHTKIYGFRSDLERIELLHASLLTQAMRDMTRAEVPYWDNTAAYRRTWLTGFAAAVHTRLKQAEQRAAADHDRNHGDTSTALVLASRASRVDQALMLAHPHIKMTKASTSTGAGRADGWAAGHRADIGNTRLGGRTSIGGAR